MRGGIRVIGLAVAIVWTVPALAQTQQQLDWCFKRDFSPEQKIQGCTAIVQSQQPAAARRADAHASRGDAHRTKGDLDRAMADYAEAIRFNPEHAGALSVRCGMQRHRGTQREEMISRPKTSRSLPLYLCGEIFQQRLIPAATAGRCIARRFG